MMTLLSLLFKYGECLTLTLSQPRFSQKMALAPHLYTLAFGLAARKKEGETEVRGKEENDGETDTWSTHPKKEQGGGIKPERLSGRQRNLCVVA